MTQHLITIIKLRNCAATKAAISRFRKRNYRVELNQQKNPSLLYWSQHYDPWLSTIEYSFRLPVKVLTVELFELIDQDSALRWLRQRIRRKYQYNETRWYHQRLIDAIQAYKSMLSSRLFIINQTFAASVTDKQLA